MDRSNGLTKDGTEVPKPFRLRSRYALTFRPVATRQQGHIDNLRHMGMVGGPGDRLDLRSARRISRPTMIGNKGDHRLNWRSTSL